jgi:predicted nucleotidyltransferase
LFCVVGYLHPPDSYTAYLKYIPATDGKWSRGETRYARAIPYYHVSQVEETYAFLRERYPRYLFSCPVRNITLSSVPCTMVKTYYRPRRRLRSLLAEGAGDILEQRLIDLVTLLSDLSGLSEGDFGVTGSLLTGSHSPEFSDIDITVYGFRASQGLKAALIEAAGGRGAIQTLSCERMVRWSLNRTGRFPLRFEELMDIAKRRWNYGLYRGTYFSVHPVRTDGEISERYGDRIYRQRGVATGTAEITNSDESIYLPTIYHVENAEMEAEAHVKVEQVISYEGLFCDIFEEGERIEFRGILEEVSDDGGHWRVVVGGAGSGGGYIKPAA